MHCILHGISAFEYWRSSISNSYAVSYPMREPDVYKVFGSSSACSLGDVRKRLTKTDGVQGNLHLLVASRAERIKSPIITCHTWNEGRALPPGSIMQIGSRVDSASPELCLVQMAPSVTRLQLARAITDLCAQYATSFDNRLDLIQRIPVTTLDRVIDFATHNHSLTGASQVLKTARWCIESVRSPRETTMGLFFSLPTRLGGKQLPTFEANGRIDFTGDAALLTRRSHLEGDAVWRGARTIVEYNSDEFHDTEEAREFDLEKINALREMCYEVIPISTRQFNSYDALEVIVRQIRGSVHSGLTKRATKREAAFRRENTSRQTHAELLAEERRQRELPSLAATSRWRFLLSQM